MKTYVKTKSGFELKKEKKSHGNTNGTTADGEDDFVLGKMIMSDGLKKNPKF